MDGTGKCYWLDCALLNAFFFFFSPLPPFFFCVLNLVWQFYVSSPFAFPPLFIYLFIIGTGSMGNYWQLLKSPRRGECLPCSSQAYRMELEQL